MTSDQTLTNHSLNPFLVQVNQIENNLLIFQDDKTPMFIFCACDMRNGRAFYFSHHKVGSDLPGQPMNFRSRYDMTTVNYICT